jgi:tetraacyldisaccharide 4'-kinase
MSRSGDTLAEKIWYGDSALRWLLLPFTWIYSAVTACRRYLYSSGILRVHKLHVPVIVVGNITAGGTGKTPLTLWFAEQLAAKGYQPGIISRGYRGSVGPEPVVVTAGSDPAIVGDEAVLMATRSACPVVVHPDRVAAANAAIEQGADLIISDDGLQHYRLGRDFEVAVIDGARVYGNRQLLPAGPLREPLSRLNTIDQILVQRETDDSPELLHRSADSSPKNFRLAASAIRRLDDSDIRSCGDFAGTRMHALAGIGNPERFFRLLEAHDIKVIRHPLGDHADIKSYDRTFADGLEIVMTEKDAVKCRWLGTRNHWYVPVDVLIEDANAEYLLNRILRKIERGDGNQDLLD